MKIDRVRGHLDLVLLGILAQEPGHGYAVITALRERTDGFLDLPEGSVYPALHRLEDLGLLTSEWGPVGGRRRRVYRLTERGSQALAGERRDWRSLVAAVEATLRPAPRSSLAGEPA
ncbi:MAG TPA: PadR family transcriptional regulator [Acidimicrobiales bacterium]|jgi:DNA-binding PadR family transcriptional regulator|nr:PadR family transcriptional regulator [Acidimicrobiales bacterium]